jgi:hypothetical protein
MKSVATKIVHNALCMLCIRLVTVSVNDVLNPKKQLFHNTLHNKLHCTQMATTTRTLPSDVHDRFFCDAPTKANPNCKTKTYQTER